MREIKFRVYDGNNKCFHYPETIELNRGIDYERFTGKVDKNNKEIYEWDIVMVKVRGGYWRGLVQFYRSCFIVNFDATDSCLCEILKGSIEIVGNIHENPDLLERGIWGYKWL